MKSENDKKSSTPLADIINNARQEGCIFGHDKGVVHKSFERVKRSEDTDDSGFKNDLPMSPDA